MLQASKGAGLVFYCNPNNPTATYVGAKATRDFLAKMTSASPDTTILVDEAYFDYVTDPDHETHVPVAIEQKNVIVARTFSKAYGMAGVRVGYAIGEAGVIKAFDKVRNHFDVSRIAQAGAIAALGDQPYLQGVVSSIARARARIGEIAKDSGLAALPSATNFVAIDCGRDGAHARRVLAALVARDVFVRMPGVAPLDRCIRVSVGTDADLAIFAEELPRALAASAGPRS